MSATTEHIGARTSTPTDNRNRAIAVKNRTPVLRVCARRLVATIARLAAELPSLFEALSRRFGSIAVALSPKRLVANPPSLKHQGGEVILDAAKIRRTS